KAVVKKSGKIAEAPPSAAAGWKPSIFLDFEGARTPAFSERAASDSLPNFSLSEETYAEKLMFA
ncbi:hypothetical protein N5E83_20265, partial [Stutzerimonas stutzeri]|uniref:hypothetical protein n=1 Tax=Stutzerimonas stutzeri TaxID=316 RepID=UPI00244C8562